jgi:hypothetical protein
MAPGFGGVERQCLLGAAHGLLLAAHQQVSPISTELGVRSKSVCLRVTTVELARAGKEGIGLGVLVMMKLFSPLQEIVSSSLTSASTNPADRTSLLPGFLFITGAATHLSPQNRIAKWLHYRIRPQSRDAGSGLIRVPHRLRQLT